MIFTRSCTCCSVGDSSWRITDFNMSVLLYFSIHCQTEPLMVSTSSAVSVLLSKCSNTDETLIGSMFTSWRNADSMIGLSTCPIPSFLSYKACKSDHNGYESMICTILSLRVYRLNESLLTALSSSPLLLSDSFPFIDRVKVISSSNSSYVHDLRILPKISVIRSI